MLAGLDTFGSYHTTSKTVSPVVIPVDHGRPPLLQVAITEQIQKKRAKASGYPMECRPLWLLLDIDIHFGFDDYTAVARAVIESANVTEFDRVIVQQTYAPPLVIDF